MINLLLKDNDNMRMQAMHYITDFVENRIYNKLFELNQNGYNLSVESLTSETTEYWSRKGFKLDDNLFKRIMTQYNKTKNLSSNALVK